MTSRTIRAASNALLLTACVLFAGCVTTNAPVQPEMTQLQIRELQTREYEGVKQVDAMKAVIAALMDEGYVISNANDALGLVTADKDVEAVNESEKQAQIFWYGNQAKYQTMMSYEANCTIAPHDGQLRVRINIQAKGMDNNGAQIWVHQALDAKDYQALFSKIDKSLFLEKEKI